MDIKGYDYVLLQDAMRPSSVSPFTGHHLPFIGFSFTENRYVDQCSPVTCFVVVV